MGCFSFGVAHNIQAGELGAVTTNDLNCYKTLKKIKAHGRMCDCPVCHRDEGKCPRPVEPDPRFTFDIFGLNFKATEFEAALALCQLKKADWIQARRQENVLYLNKGLEQYSGVFTLPEYSTDVSYLAYPIIIKHPDVISRGAIRRRLEEAGIESRPLYDCDNGFYVGVHQYLTKKDLDRIIQVLKGSLC